ncbi:hypothetical protein FA95DRAFT_1136172 [Auriscalpium vulgare]|uniref:Uncharacterized protein n=1 Tax=Auriscalpium vulgare TaxID=40419 RepID=A0ACB8R422_9AGAM|nr:hypothetical protein FA95DRAFT_1136172 [Auriscalpium vulgare]
MGAAMARISTTRTTSCTCSAGPTPTTIRHLAPSSTHSSRASIYPSSSISADTRKQAIQLVAASMATSSTLGPAPSCGARTYTMNSAVIEDSPVADKDLREPRTTPAARSISPSMPRCRSSPATSR